MPMGFLKEIHVNNLLTLATSGLADAVKLAVDASSPPTRYGLRLLELRITGALFCQLSALNPEDR